MYILILLWHITGDAEMLQVEFTSKLACEQAITEIRKAEHNVYATCVKR